MASSTIFLSGTKLVLAAETDFRQFDSHHHHHKIIKRNEAFLSLVTLVDARKNVLWVFVHLYLFTAL